MAHFLCQIGHETGRFNSAGFAENTCFTEKADWGTWFNLTWKEPPFNAACSDARKGKRKNPWKKLEDVPLDMRCNGGVLSRKVSGEKLYNYVLRCEGGNGDENSGHGYKYRGHGFIQLTWKKQYEQFDNWLKEQGLGRDYKKVLTDPDLAFADLEIACLSGMWYWSKGDCNELADLAVIESRHFDDRMKVLTKKINIGLKNLEDRIGIFKKAYEILDHEKE